MENNVWNKNLNYSLTNVDRKNELKIELAIYRDDTFRNIKLGDYSDIYIFCIIKYAQIFKLSNILVFLLCQFLKSPPLKGG